MQPIRGFTSVVGVWTRRTRSSTHQDLETGGSSGLASEAGTHRPADRAVATVGSANTNLNTWSSRDYRLYAAISDRKPRAALAEGELGRLQQSVVTGEARRCAVPGNEGDPPAISIDLLLTEAR